MPVMSPTPSVIPPQPTLITIVNKTAFSQQRNMYRRHTTRELHPSVKILAITTTSVIPSCSRRGGSVKASTMVSSSVPNSSLSRHSLQQQDALLRTFSYHRQYSVSCDQLWVLRSIYNTHKIGANGNKQELNAITCTSACARPDR